MIGVVLYTKLLLNYSRHARASPLFRTKASRHWPLLQQRYQLLFLRLRQLWRASRMWLGL